MATINIDCTAPQLRLEVTFGGVATIAYRVRVFFPDNRTEKELMRGDNINTNDDIILLAHPENYNNSVFALSTDVDLIDPGSFPNFSVKLLVSQDGNEKGTIEIEGDQNSSNYPNGYKTARLTC